MDGLKRYSLLPGGSFSCQCHMVEHETGFFHKVADVKKASKLKISDICTRYVESVALTDYEFVAVRAFCKWIQKLKSSPFV